MRRRIIGVLSVLALALCTARVASWAAPAADPHACCHTPKGTVPPASLVECCPAAAAAVAPHVLAPVLTALTCAAPAVAPAPRLVSSATVPAAPPGPRAYRAASPARAPPLA